MKKAEQGDTVEVHYTGKLEDGTVFDTSKERGPLEFTIGEGRIIPGFEEAVVGMAPEESKTISVPPDKAYGEHNSELTKEFPRDQLPENVEAKPGQPLQLTRPDGKTIDVMITDISDDSFTVDANHPLAGKTLTFDIEVVAVK